MNETIEPDYIEKGFQTFNKLNKNIKSSAEQASKFASEQMKNTTSQPIVQNAIASHGSMILIMAVFIVFMLFTSNYSMSMTYETSWLAIPILLLVAYGLSSFVKPLDTTNN